MMHVREKAVKHLAHRVRALGLQPAEARTVVLRAQELSRKSRASQLTIRSIDKAIRELLVRRRTEWPLSRLSGSKG